eukprot:1122994-Amphidinium_carterae.1
MGFHGSTRFHKEETVACPKTSPEHMTCLAVQTTPLRNTDKAAASGSATGAKNSTSSGWTSRGGGSCLAL